MRNFVQPGDVVTAIAPAGGIVSGAGVLIGSLFGVATTTQAEGAEVELAVVGVVDLVKATGGGTALTAGGVAYWDSVAKKVTGVGVGNTLIGIATVTAGDSATSVRVRLNGFAGLNSDAGVAATLADHEDRITALEPP